MIPREFFVASLKTFFAPIAPYFEDPTVTDILINGPSVIHVERRGVIEATGARFESADALLAALRNAAQFMGRPLDAEHPILEGRLPDGSRLEAVLPPVAPDGPIVSIRRFYKETLTIERLLQFGSLSVEAAQSLAAMVIGKLNIVVSGGTGSGKTSLLNAMSAYVPEAERIVVIEDARELQVQRPHVVHLEARPADAKGKGQVTIRDLFRATLRLRPDRIFVGELRGGETMEFVQAATSGHGGCMATLHASHPLDALRRMETMGLMSDVAMPLEALRQQVGSAVEVVVQTNRLPDGSRRVTHVTEVLGWNTERGAFEAVDLFHRPMTQAADGRFSVGNLVPTGHLLRRVDRLREHGHDLPASVYDAARKHGGA
jgi:pilus assembly protein CpaF